jgi:hypothetical protein
LLLFGRLRISCSSDPGSDYGLTVGQGKLSSPTVTRISDDPGGRAKAAEFYLQVGHITRNADDFELPVG